MATSTKMVGKAVLRWPLTWGDDRIRECGGQAFLNSRLETLVSWEIPKSD